MQSCKRREPAGAPGLQLQTSVKPPSAGRSALRKGERRPARAAGGDGWTGSCHRTSKEDAMTPRAQGRESVPSFERQGRHASFRARGGSSRWPGVPARACAPRPRVEERCARRAGPPGQNRALGGHRTNTERGCVRMARSRSFHPGGAARLGSFAPPAAAQRKGRRRDRLRTGTGKGKTDPTSRGRWRGEVRAECAVWPSLSGRRVGRRESSGGQGRSDGSVASRAHLRPPQTASVSSPRGCPATLRRRARAASIEK